MHHTFHQTEAAAKQAFQTQVDETLAKHSWIGIVGFLEGDRLTLKKSIGNFPEMEQIRVLRQLKEMIDKELGLSLTPLPLAPHLRMANPPDLEDREDDDEDQEEHEFADEVAQSLAFNENREDDAP